VPPPAPEASPEGPPPPAPEAAPERPPAPEAAPERPSPTPPQEASTEGTRPGPIPEGGSPPPSLVTSQSALGEAAPAVLGPVVGPPPTAAVVGDPRAKPGGGTGSVGASAGLLAALGFGGLNCTLSGLERRTARDCAAGSAEAQRLLGVPLISAGPTNGDATGVATAGAPADGDQGGSAVGSRPPVNPAPGPAPGGAAGGATGGSGLALSAFLTLAALLRLAPSRAMRRLRLLCAPRLTACFALIPERPG